MKHLAIALVIMWTAFATAQQPQWVVVASTAVYSQNSSVPNTTLFTPTQAGMYRLDFYFSAGIGAEAAGEYQATLAGADITTNQFSYTLLGTCGYPRVEPFTTLVSLEANVPLTYQVTSENAPACAYNMMIAVEQLEQ